MGEQYSEEELGHAFAEGQPAFRFWPEACWWQPSKWDSIIQSKIYEQDQPVKMLRWLAAAQPVLALELMKNFQNSEMAEIRQEIEKAAYLHVSDKNIFARAAAYRILGELNADMRFGIYIPTKGDILLPEFAWVKIPSGYFLAGDQKEQRWGDAVLIAAYPVTNAQYEIFIKSQGYLIKRYWTKAGLDWSQTYDIKQPYSLGSSFEISNDPRVGISWYEAIAYTRWLNELYAEYNIPFKVRLPSEFELERAIRGDRGSRFAYGNEVDYTICNGGGTGLGSTCAVGIFPEGLSPYGLYDATGNVWEWTLSTPSSEWGNNIDSDESRVIRGGSWNYFGDYLRCAFRYWYAPISRNAMIGMRLVAAFDQQSGFSL